MNDWTQAGAGPTVAAVGEFALIDRIARLLAGGQGAGVTLGIGDDTCVLRPTAGRELLATCDSLVEGRHFLVEYCSPTDVGRRAAAVNLSDVGAMGGEPRAALVSLGLRPEVPVAAVEALYQGLVAEFAPLGVSIVGGNCTGVTGPCFIDVTLLGEVEVGQAVRRSGARVGDAVLLTGYSGVGAAGLAVLQAGGAAASFPTLCAAYRRPCHRAREGRALGLSGQVHAMVDVSDGLPGDLEHLARASEVGVVVEVEQLPRHPELLAAAQGLGVNPREWLLGASDDYELLLACAPGDVDAVVAVVGRVSTVPLTRIGTVVAEPGVVWRDGDGRCLPVTGGWDHYREASVP